MGHGASNRRVGDTEHRLLEADTDLHMNIGLPSAMAVVPAAELIGKVAIHVLHAKARRDPRPHAWKRVGIERSVAEAALIRRDLLSLGVVRHGSQERHPAEEHRLHIRDSHIHQEGEASFRREDPDGLTTDLHLVGDRIGGGSHQTITDVMDHIVDAGHLTDAIATGKVNKHIAHHTPEQPKGIDGGE